MATLDIISLQISAWDQGEEDDRRLLAASQFEVQWRP